MFRGLSVAAAVVLSLVPAVTVAGELLPGPIGTSGALAEALARAPASPEIRDGIVSYVDYRAVEAARPGAGRPTSSADWQALRDAGDPSARLWTAAYMGVASGSGELLRSLYRSGADWPAVVGLDFFDVDRELAFGLPPGDGLVLLGRFDPAAIERAFAGRGYTSTAAGDRTLLCGPGGCDSGMDVDLSRRETANPFGGELGRMEPLAVSASDILDSASGATVRAMLGAAGHPDGSLAGDPANRAAADALSAAGPVVQATFVPGPLVQADIVSMLVSGGDAARAELERLAASFEPIPAYQLLAFADSATGTEQVVTIALVYDNAAGAQRAVDVIPGRIDVLPSLRMKLPLRDLLDGRGVTSVEGQVVPSADGRKSLAVFTLRAPLAPSEPGSDGLTTASSLVYRMLVTMVGSRDTLWLAPSLPDLR